MRLTVPRAMHRQSHVRVRAYTASGQAAAKPAPLRQWGVALAAAATVVCAAPAFADDAAPAAAPSDAQAELVRPAAPSDARRERLMAVAKQVERDFTEGQYYVTGKLTPSLYEPDALFIDPTTRVQGVDKYTAAVAALFDPEASRADLISIAEGPDDDVITLRWRLEGRLKLLGGLPIKPYTGTTRYVLDDAGLISQHLETWDITAADAFLSTFFPSYGAPPAPPVSQLR